MSSSLSGDGRQAVSGSRVVTMRPSAERSRHGEGPGTWDSGLSVPASPGSRGPEHRRGGQGSPGSVSAVRASVWLLLCPVVACAVGWMRLRALCAGETDTACDQPAEPRPTRDPGQSRVWVPLLPSRASRAAGEAPEGRAQLCAGERSGWPGPGRPRACPQPGGCARPRGARCCRRHPLHMEHLLYARLSV